MASPLHNSAIDNYGYEFTWNGCDTILVAVGSAG